MTTTEVAQPKKVMLPSAAALEAATAGTAGLTAMSSASASVAGYNPRRMRRIVVEDPEWNLSAVPSLLQLCLNVVIQRFAQEPALDRIPAKLHKKVLDGLSTNLPLELVVKEISDEGYWQRCCEARFDNTHCKKADVSYKRFYMEQHLTGLLEKHVPGTDDAALQAAVALAKDYVVALDVKQLQPPPMAEPDVVEEPRAMADDELDTLDHMDEHTGSKEGASKAANDHLDLGIYLEQLTKLQSLKVSYQIKECGMKFKWKLFGMTKGDANMMADCIKYSCKLQRLAIQQSLIDDRRLRMMAAKMLDNQFLTHLDLSHNVIGDKGARALAKLINGHSVLEQLDICDNQICSVGARALAMALQNTTTLRTLNLRLNNIGDQGAHALFTCLIANSSLKRLNVSSNRLTNLVTPALSEMLEKNHGLEHLDLTCNELGDECGKRVLDALDRNHTLLSMDMRLSGFAKDTELAINEVLSENLKQASQLPLRR